MYHFRSISKVRLISFIYTILFCYLVLPKLTHTFECHRHSLRSSLFIRGWRPPSLHRVISSIALSLCPLKAFNGATTSSILENALIALPKNRDTVVLLPLNRSFCWRCQFIRYSIKGLYMYYDNDTILRHRFF